MRNGILVIVSGPSGVGKGSVIKKLITLKGFALSISATTRKPRSFEKNEKDYFFMSKEEFLQHINNKDMVEYNEYCGCFYGTLKSRLNMLLEENDVVLLEIDVNGASIVSKVFDCVRIFLLPPNFEELKKRLVKRGTETQESLKNRLNKACYEIKRAVDYDYLVVNDEIEKAAKKIKMIAKTESLRTHRSKFKIERILKNEF